MFLLPPESGEKITLTITILLALTVFLQLITEYTPKAAETLPIIGIYFNFNLILVLTSIILTITVLNFQFRGPKKTRVPRWMRVYIIGYLGRVFCFGKMSQEIVVKSSIKSEKAKPEKANANRNETQSAMILNLVKTESDISLSENLNEQSGSQLIKKKLL